MSLSEQKSTPLPWLVRLLLGLVLVGPLVWLAGIHDYTDVPKGMLIQLGALILLCCWLMSAAWRGELTLRFSKILPPLAAFLAWGGVALMYAHNPYEGFWSLFRWLPALPIVVIGAAILRESSWRRGLLMAIGAAGALTALLGTIQVLTGWSPVEQVRPPAASFANRNVAVDFVLLTLSVNVGLVLDESRTWRRMLTAAAIFLSLFFIGATASRAAWLSVAIQGGLWMGYLGCRWWRTREVKMVRRMSLVMTIAVLAVIAVMGLVKALSSLEVKLSMGQRLPMWKLLDTPQSAERNKRSADWRIRTWGDTLGMIRDHPWLGVGLGNHKVQFPLYQRHQEGLRNYEIAANEKARMEAHVHNDFLQLWAETGLVGILLLLWLTWAVAREYRANFARMLPGCPASTWGIAVAVLGGLLVSASFSFPLYRAGPPLLLAGFLAVIAASGPDAAVVAKKGHLVRAWCGAGAALVIVVMGMYLFWAWRFLQAERWYRLMVGANNQKLWDWVVGCGEEVLQHDPWRRRTYLYVGRALVSSGHPAEAIAAIEEFLQAYPHHLNAWYNLGLAYGAVGDDDDAIRAYRNVLSLNPDIAMAHNNLGCIYLRRNELDEAEEAFCGAAANDPGNASVWNNLGLTAIRRKDLAAAETRFMKAVALNPKSVQAHRNLGVLYVQYLGRTGEGMTQLRRAIELDPKMPEAEVIRKMLREAEKK